MSNPFMAASPQQPASPSSEESVQVLEKKVEMLSAQLAKALEIYQLLEMENARLRKINAFQAEQIATLEEQLRSNSRNSNRPPSSDPPFPNGPGVPSSKKSGRSAKKKTVTV
nr:DUF6444 domain-containing protein [Desulfovibrio sp.]